jgi:hypothetical protein
VISHYHQDNTYLADFKPQDDIFLLILSVFSSKKLKNLLFEAE